jgi:molybdopterin-guanine dinucleotide biosynthesis protein A
MGGADKGLALWQDRALVDWMLERLRAQQGLSWQALAISANRNLADYARRGLPLLQDDPSHPDQGPLAGMLQALRFARESRCQAVWLLPCDTPLLPPELAGQLLHALRQSVAPAMVPALEQPGAEPRWQAAHALLRVELELPLRERFEQGERRLQAVLRELGAQTLSLPSTQASAFANFNTLADLQGEPSAPD